uniref:B2 bradykinin receptor-like n=1 Tax=Scatophagus argus TaxID=75038 RepID=UPI001ED7E5F1|nr:B2 bradykinin receptor-like [Scatophagus argus]
MTFLPTSVQLNFSTVATYGGQNNTNGTNCSQIESEEWIITVVPVYILLLTALGIVCNMFVLMVFCLHKKPCTVPEIYLSNLAAADLVLLACLPFWAVNISNRFNWLFGHFLCKVVNLGISMNTYCSIYFLVLVSVDRYIALVHPLSHNRMRRTKYAKLGCVVVWGLGLLLSIPKFIFRVVEPRCNQTLCYNKYPEGTHLPFDVMLTVFGFIIPIFFISYCTAKIIHTLNNRLSKGLNSHNTEHKSTTLVLAVLLAFLICWVPFHVVTIAEALTRAKLLKADLNVLDTSIHICIYLAFFNSVLNPILYVIVGKNFRRKVKELFKKRSRGATFNNTSVQSYLTRSVKSVNVTS